MSLRAANAEAISGVTVIAGSLQDSCFNRCAISGLWSGIGLVSKGRKGRVENPRLRVAVLSVDW